MLAATRPAVSATTAADVHTVLTLATFALECISTSGARHAPRWNERFPRVSVVWTDKSVPERATVAQRESTRKKQPQRTRSRREMRGQRRYDRSTRRPAQPAVPAGERLCDSVTRWP